MDRRLLLTGAIIISILMALSLYIPISITTISFIVFSSLYLLIKKRLYYYCSIVSIFLTLSSLGVIRTSKRNYIPINRNDIQRVDVTITRDSKRRSYGYVTTGIISKFYGINIVAKGWEEVAVFSNKELYSSSEFLKVEYDQRGLNIDEGSGEIKFRVRVLNRLSKRVDSNLLFAMLTGNKNRVEKSKLNLFRKSGLSHIIALSGFHIGIIVLLIYLMFRLLLPQKFLYFLTLIILGFYIYLIGVTPSLFRSILMYFIGVIYKIRYNRVDIKVVFIYSFIITIIINPNDFYSISFSLSYLSLLGILYLTPILEELKIFTLTPNSLRSTICASIGAILATGISITYTFGEIYPIGIISSIVISPVIVIYMFIGIASIAVTPLEVVISLLDKLIFTLCSLFSRIEPVVINDKNIYFVTFIFISLPVILCIIKILRSRDVRRFNTEFKL